MSRCGAGNFVYIKEFTRNIPSVSNFYCALDFRAFATYCVLHTFF